VTVFSSERNGRVDSLKPGDWGARGSGVGGSRSLTKKEALIDEPSRAGGGERSTCFHWCLENKLGNSAKNGLNRKWRNANRRKGEGTTVEKERNGRIGTGSGGEDWGVYKRRLESGRGGLIRRIERTFEFGHDYIEGEKGRTEKDPNATLF